MATFVSTCGNLMNSFLLPQSRKFRLTYLEISLKMKLFIKQKNTLTENVKKKRKFNVNRLNLEGWHLNAVMP